MTQPILSPELPTGAEPARARITAAWLRDETEAVNDLLNQAQRPEVGVVGAKLLDHDGKVTQAGHGAALW